MKIRNLPLLFSLAALSATNSAWALTAANTPINNTATISYDVGGTTQADIGSSPTGNDAGAGTATTFVVDRVIDLTVTEGSDVNVVPGSAAVTPTDITFDLANTGNDTEIFDITLLPGITNDETGGNADDFDTTGCSITGVAGGGATTSALTVTLPKESTTTVTVNCDIPVTGANVSNGKISHLEFHAKAQRAQDNASADVAGTVQTVYADALAANTTDSATKNGEHADINTFVIQTTQLKVTKESAVVCDPYNDTTNPKRIPGAVVQYTITVENEAAAGAAADNVVVNDPIPANMTYVSAAPAGCSYAVVASATSDDSGTNAVTLSGSETGGATVISRTIDMPVDSQAKLVFFAEVQ